MPQHLSAHCVCSTVPSAFPVNTSTLFSTFSRGQRTRSLWWTCSFSRRTASGLYSNTFITAIRSLHGVWHLRLTDLSRLLLSSQTLICVSQSQSEGITKINWVVFPLNLGCVFSLSTGGLLNKSISCQLHISGKQIQGFFTAVLLSETMSYSWVIIDGKLILELSQLVHLNEVTGSWTHLFN